MNLNIIYIYKEIRVGIERIKEIQNYVNLKKKLKLKLKKNKRKRGQC